MNPFVFLARQVAPRLKQGYKAADAALGDVLPDNPLNAVEKVANATLVPVAAGISSQLASKMGYKTDVPLTEPQRVRLESEFREGLPKLRQKGAPVNPLLNTMRYVPGFGLGDVDVQTYQDVMKGTSGAGDYEVGRGQGRMSRYSNYSSDGGYRIQVDPMDTSGGRFRFPATTMAHEMGHGVDYDTPKGRQTFIDRVRKERMAGAGFNQGPDRGYSAPYKIRFGGKMTPHFGKGLPGVVASVFPTSNPAEDAVIGGITGVLQPDNMSTMISEARADKFGRQLAKRAGTPFKLPTQLGHRFSYGAVPFMKGAKQGLAAGLINYAAQPVIDRIAEVGSDALVRGMDFAIPGGLKHGGRDLYFDTDGRHFRYEDTGADARIGAAEETAQAVSANMKKQTDVNRAQSLNSSGPRYAGQFQP